MTNHIVTITGAAGNIAYSLIFRILSGNIFPKNDKIQINLLDIEPALTSLTGVKYEIEDCAFDVLSSIVTTDDPQLAFSDSDYILMVGAKPRVKGMQRADLLLDNANIFQKQSKVINECAKKTTKIIVVGNPANTNALIVQNFVKNIPSENITSLMKLDQNRAKSILSDKLDKSVTDIKKLIVWGNHSATQYPDLNNIYVNNAKNIVSDIDTEWVKNTFIPRVQNRGAEIIENRGKSSAASAASAIYDHLYILVNGSEKRVSPSKDFQSFDITKHSTIEVMDWKFYVKSVAKK